MTPNLYQSISDFLGKLKREEYDNVEKKIKDTLIIMTTNLITLLLKIRLEKAIEKLQENGFNASPTSLEPTGFRTNARIDEIKSVFSA